MNLSPSINSNGSKIAFVSEHNLTGTNADGNQELFLFDVNTLVFSQLTNSSDGDSALPSINSDGTRIAFMSFGDLTGSNSDNNFEIFLLDTTTLVLTQITNTVSGQNRFPSINGNGTRIAFESDRDLIGSNADANGEVFMFDTVTMMFSQITTTTGVSNGSPSINADGTRIAFRSSGDLTGSNPDLNSEIFRVDADTMIFTQITNTSGIGIESNGSPSINADGVRIAFVSTADIAGGNPDGNREIFLAEFPENCTPSSVLDKLESLKNFVAICPFCPPDPVESLLDKILLAIKHVQQDNPRPAVNAVRQFVSETERFMDQELIPAVQGRRFVMMAEGIIAVLEGEESARTANDQSTIHQHTGVHPEQPDGNQL